MAMSKASSLFDYLSKAGASLPEESVYIEQWDREVTLRGMTSRERDLFEEDQIRRANAKAGNGARQKGEVQADLDNFRARLVARHIIDGGMRTFANPKGEELLGNQPAAVIDKLFAVAQRLSGFSNQDIENLEKNSAAMPGAGPSSDSQASQAEPLPN